MAVLPASAASAASVPPPPARGWPFPAGTHLKFWVLTPSVMWPGHSANGRARLRFQPRRREWNKEGGREGRQAFNCVHDLDSRPAATALLSLLLLTALFVWPIVWVFGWHPLKRVGIPPLGKTQVRVRELSKEKRRRRRRQQTAAFLFHSSLPLQELRQWKNGGRSSDHLCE